MSTPFDLRTEKRSHPSTAIERRAVVSRRLGTAAPFDNRAPEDIGHMNASPRLCELRLAPKKDQAIEASSSTSITSNTLGIRALSVVFMEHRCRLEKHAAKILGSPHSAEDVVQDAYIKAVETAATREIERPASYLYQIVRNLAIDHYRRAILESRYFTSEEEGSEIVDSTGSPETIVIERLQLRSLAAALADLPKRTQRAFELHSIDGYTQREVAKQLNVSPTLVNFMIRDALKHCREATAQKECGSCSDRSADR
jgi:RNA polymerase sigma factor (sigma-70 family)